MDNNVVLNFDASTVSPEFGGSSFFPVSDEKGWLVVIAGSNGFKTANSGKGQYLELILKGQEGPVAGQDATLRLNLMHENQTAVQAAYAQLSAIAHVTGVMRIGNVSDVFNRPFRVVSVEQKQTEADKAAGKAAYTQLADNGIRDQQGNRPGKGGQGPQVAQTAPQMTQAPQMQQAQPPQGGGQAAAPQWGQQGGGQVQQQPAQQQTQAAPDWGQQQQQQGGQAVPQSGGAPAWGQPQGGAGGQPAWTQQPGQ